MFERKEESKKRKDPRPCVAWLDRVAPMFREKVLFAIDAAEAVVPELAALRVTPQSAPYHCEGPFVVDHVARILTAIFAIEDGATLADVEEFVREKDLVLDISALEATIRNYAPFLTAFAFSHDVAKPETAFFDAAENTKGAAEGFAKHERRAQKTMTQSERHRYDKLFRAFHAGHAKMTLTEAMGSFFDAYGIGIHYDDHGPHAAALQFAEIRTEIARHCGLPAAHTKMLGDIIRYHIDVIKAFRSVADRVAYAVLMARAGKAGFNVDMYLDLTLAAMFLDAVAGSAVYDGKFYRAQTSLVVTMLRAEREAAPRRHHEREQQAEWSQKREYKKILADAQLDGDAVFALLSTPLGPVRGDVMRRVMDALNDPSSRTDFGVDTGEIYRRITLARKKLGL